MVFSKKYDNSNFKSNKGEKKKNFRNVYAIYYTYNQQHSKFIRKYVVSGFYWLL